jgi:hypothetical protein
MHAWFAQLLETSGYWAVALVVMGESVGLPVPGETLLLLGAASAGAGYLEVWGVIGVAAGGALVGDSLGYALGRWGGRPPRLRRRRAATLRAALPLLERYGRVLHLQSRHLARAEAFFARYGGRSAWAASSPSCAPIVRSSRGSRACPTPASCSGTRRNAGRAVDLQQQQAQPVAYWRQRQGRGYLLTPGGAPMRNHTASQDNTIWRCQPSQVRPWYASIPASLLPRWKLASMPAPAVITRARSPNDGSAAGPEAV